MSTIKATNDFVFVVRNEAEKVKDGLYIPSKGIEKQPKGTIVSVGELTQDKKIKSGTGKLCYFHRGSGFELEYEGVTYLVLNAPHIIAVL